MTRKVNEKKKVISEGANPAAPLAPQAFPTDATSKAMFMANIVNGIAEMPPADLLPFYEKWQALIGQEASSIPDGAAAQNLQSINSGNAVVSEELKAILETETLSEDTKERASVLFEAAVSSKVAFIKAELEEANESKLNEEIDRINTVLNDQINQYLTYVAEQWMKDNKAAVKQSIRTELAESFISNMAKVINEHYFTISDEQVDAVEALSEEVKSLREKLNAQINENVETKRALEEFRKDEVIRQETDGLAVTQVEKVRKLAEGVDFNNDVDSFRKKVKIIRESNVPTSSKSAPLITEGVPSVIEEEYNLQKKPTSLDGLARYISQSVKR